jgi:hypothetical protein
MEDRHVDIVARDVEHRRIVRLLEQHRALGLGHDVAAEVDGDAVAGGRDRNRMVGTGDLHRLRLS